MKLTDFFNPVNSWKLRYDGWEAMSNVLSALRGPDSDSEAVQDLKEIVTARLRFIVAKGFSGDVNGATLSKSDVQTVKRVAGRMQRREQQEHFLSHLRWAVQATVQHPIWDGLGLELLSALSISN